MTTEEFWKNFNLGTELQISGNFLYNGILAFHQMKNFYNEDEIFEFIYNVSVGIERLMKIDLILIEHSNSTNQSEFEETLKTHNHLALLQRIQKEHNLNLEKSHNNFLQLLFNFYKKVRYDRYSLSNVREFEKEKDILIKFIEKFLKIKINNETFNVTKNNKEIKRFIGNVIKKLAEELYQVLRKEARKLNIYTYEVRYGSKAFKIFIANDFTFEKEDIIRKEIVISLLDRKKESDFTTFIKNIDKLEFEDYHENYYIRCLLDILECYKVYGELECLYEEVEKLSDRLELVELVGSDMSFDFSDPFEFDE